MRIETAFANEGEKREKTESPLPGATAWGRTLVSDSVRVKMVPREIVKYAHWEITKCQIIDVKES